MVRIEKKIVRGVAEKKKFIQGASEKRLCSVYLTIKFFYVFPKKFVRSILQKKKKKKFVPRVAAKKICWRKSAPRPLQMINGQPPMDVGMFFTFQQM